MTRKILPLLCLFLALLAGNVYAQTTEWFNPGTGKWENPTNWTGGIPATSGTAQIRNGGTVLVDTATGPVTVSSLHVTYTSGTRPTGTLILENGGKVTVSSTMDIGFGNGNTGYVTVDGPGSELTTLSLHVGCTGGTGFLSIINGGKVTTTSPTSGIGFIGTGSSGTLFIDEDSTLSSTTTFSIGSTSNRGLLYGTGKIEATTVTVNSTGTLSPGNETGESGTLNIVGNLHMASGSTIQYDPGDLINVTGDVLFGSTLNLSLSSLTDLDSIVRQTIIEATGTMGTLTTINVGVAGNNRVTGGSATVSAVGGKLEITALSDPNWDNAAVTWRNDGGQNNLWDMTSTNWMGAGGITQFLDGDAVTFNNTADLTIDIVGTQRAVAQMRVFGTGDLIINGNILGDDNLSNPTTVGDSEFIKDGSGTLTLNGRSRFVGDISMLGGGVTNIGSGSELTTESVLQVYDSAALNITGGGKVAAATDMTVGYHNDGTATVDGNGSALTGNLLYVGRLAGGNGTLNITNGGKVVAADDIILGHNDNATGTATVSGSGSELKGSDIYVGNRGTGILNLTDGGKAAAGNNVFIGMAAGSTGAVLVDSGSELFSTGNVYVGGNATTPQGTGFVIGSGKVTASEVVVYSTGTLTPIGILEISGNLTMNDGSTLRVDINGTWGSSDFVRVEGTANIGAINVNLSSVQNGNYQLIASTVPGGVGLTYTDNSANVLLNGLSLEGSRATATTTSDGSALFLSLVTGNNTTIHWTGAENGKWDYASKNWEDSLGDTTFLDGDIVVFNIPREPATASAVIIDIEGTRKTVADMFVQGDGNLTINGNIRGESSTLGNGSLEKTDTGTLTLNGSSGFERITLNGGTTNIGSDAGLKIGGNLIVGENNTAALNITGGGTVAVGSNYDVLIGHQSTGKGTVLVGSGSHLNLSGSGNVYVGSGADGTGLLAGNGTVTANAVQVGENGTISPGDVWGEIGTLTINGNGTGNGNLRMYTGSTLRVDLGPGNVSDKIVVSGVADIGNGINIDLSSLRNGTYTLLTSSTLSYVGNSAVIKLNGLDIPTTPGSRAAGITRMAMNIGNTDLRLSISGVTNYASLTWTGADGDNLWNLTSDNWTNSDTKFLDGDGVIFNDTATPVVIDIVGTQKTITDMLVFSNGDWTFNGNILADGSKSGIGAGTTSRLTKMGTGSLTLNGENEFLGGINFQGGTIVLGTDKSLGTWKQNAVAGEFLNSQGGVVVTNGAATIKVTENRTISNHFVVGNPFTSNPTGTLIFDIAEGKTLTIDGVVNTSTNGFLENGGAINVNVGGGSALQFTDSSGGSGGNLVFSNNSAARGGAVGTDGGINISLDFRGLDSVTFMSNKATLYGGGAIYAREHVTLGDFATFTDNSANQGGGAITTAFGSVTLGNNATFTGNLTGTGNFSGGAINAETYVAIGNNATFTENTATGNGGAIYAFGDVTLGDNATFTGNRAGTHGGAIYANTSVELGNNATFTENTAGDLGGAIRAGQSVTLGGDATFTGNTATDNGGAIWTSQSVTLGDNAIFTGNRATNGYGGAICANTGSVTLGGNAKFTGNTANQLGGAIFASQNVILGGDATFTNNSAGGGDGGAIAAGQDVFLNAGTIAFSGNTAGGLGKTIYAVNSVTVAANATLLSDIDTDILTPTLNLANGSTLAFDLTKAVDKADTAATTNLILTGTVNQNAGDKSNVSLVGWQTGTFTLMTATGGGIDESNFNDIVVGSRQTAVLSSPTANELILTTSSRNLNLTWTGGTDGNWDTTTIDNWHLAGTPTQKETFNLDDYVIFNTMATPQTITVGGTGVQVSGMEITGGEYTFDGGTITGVDTAVSTGQTVSGKLAVTGSNVTYNSVTFNNTINFVGGVEIGNEVTLNVGSGLIDCDLEMLTGSTLSVKVNREDGLCDTLAVSGTVTIASDAKLHIYVVEETGDYNDFLILQAGNIIGEFELFGAWKDDFTSKIDGGEYRVLWTRLTPDFAGIIAPYATTNAYNAAVAVDKIGKTGGIDDLYDALAGMPSGDVQALADAFAQLHGEVFAAGKQNSVKMQKSFLWQLPGVWDRFTGSNDGIYRGQCDPCAPCGTRTQSAALSRWATFTGDWLERKSVGSASGYDLRSAGVAVGIDQKLSRNSFAGVAFGYDNAYQSFKSIRSTNQMDVFRTALHGGIRNGNTYADGYLGYTKDWNKTRRDINIGGIGGSGGGGSAGSGFAGVARSKFDDDIFSTGFEIGRKLSLGNSRLTPSIGLHYIHLSSPEVTESGANDADLLILSGSYNSLRMPMGARLSRDFWSGGIVWTPEVRAFYIREMMDASVRTGTSFANANTVPFYAESGNWGRNSGRFGTGVNAQLSNWLNFRVDYDYEVYDYTAASEFSATLGVKW